MADAKLSAFPVVSALNFADKIPVLQDGQNKLATVGQLKSQLNSAVNVNVVDTVIPMMTAVGVTGACTLAAASGVSRLIIVAEGTGTITSVGLLPNDGFRFTLGNVLELFWFNSKWNVLVNNGMTPGLV